VQILGNTFRMSKTTGESIPNFRGESVSRDPTGVYLIVCKSCRRGRPVKLTPFALASLLIYWRDTRGSLIVDLSDRT
jgi:hypothetical protein